MTELVRLDGVSKSFRGVAVLDSVNLSIGQGDCVAVTGPNGSGKSVLFKLICRLLIPDAGTVTIAPGLLSRRGTFPEGFGVIIDRPGYVATRTGRQNLLDLAAIRGRINAKQVAEAMIRVGLDPALEQRVGQYSLGMKQKLALAQAIMEDQQVLLLDEPFNALDEASVARTRALLQELLADGRTVVFTSHNPEDVQILATRTFRISERQLVPVG